MDDFTFWSWIIVIGMIYRMVHCQSQLTILSFSVNDLKQTFFLVKSDNINNFDDAVTKCKKLGGSLASVHTSERRLVAYELIKRARCNRKY